MRVRASETKPLTSSERKFRRGDARAIVFRPGEPVDIDKPITLVQLDDTDGITAPSDEVDGERGVPLQQDVTLRKASVAGLFESAKSGAWLFKYTFEIDHAAVRKATLALGAGATASGLAGAIAGSTGVGTPVTLIAAVASAGLTTLVAQLAYYDKGNGVRISFGVKGKLFPPSVGPALEVSTRNKPALKSCSSAGEFADRCFTVYGRAQRVQRYVSSAYVSASRATKERRQRGRADRAIKRAQREAKKFTDNASKQIVAVRGRIADPSISNATRSGLRRLGDAYHETSTNVSRALGRVANIRYK